MSNAAGRYGCANGASDMRHSRSEDLLGPVASRSPSPIPIQATASEDDLVAASALRENQPSGPRSLMLSRVAGSAGILADRIDPEDSIRDIVTENDLYRFVLFKRHYDKYITLAAKYEEAKGLAYYLEERYHEVKAERDKLEETRRALEKRLECCEGDLRGKEDELFIQLERNLRLEEEVDRAKAERDNYLAARDRLDREHKISLRRLQMQLEQNEITRKTLERARLEVVEQATAIRQERDALEKENEALKEKLRVKRSELGAERRRREDGVAALTRETITLRHAARHLRAATLHATSCRRRRRCSICVYAKRTFAEIDEYRDNGNLLKCLEAPLQDLRSWLRSSPSSSSTSASEERSSSPIIGKDINYIDRASVRSGSSTSSGDDADERVERINGISSTSSNSGSDDEAFPSTPIAGENSVSSATSTAPPTARAFSSDSGFSSEVGDRRSRSYGNGVRPEGSSSGTSSRKISESLSCGETNDQSMNGGITRSRWTNSFRKFLGRKIKTKVSADRTSKDN